jgi:HEAT repeats
MARNHSTSTLLAVAAASLVIGAAVVLVAHTDHASAGSPAVPATPTTASPRARQSIAAAAALGRLLATTRAARDLDWSDPDAFARLHHEALDSAATRKELMDQFVAAPDTEAKHTLGRLLSGVHTDDVLELAIGLAHSPDLARRRDGFELLAGLGMKLPEVRRLARETLAADHDPVIVSRAIAALQPAPVSDSENAALMSQLRPFVEDHDPRVRAQAVTALAGWDKTGEAAPALQRSLADGSPEVRWSAITAIATNRVRSDDLKQSLIAIACDANEQPSLRLDAAHALEQFSLDEADYGRVLQAAKEADKLLYPATAQAR